MHKSISGFELIKFLEKKGFSVYSRKGSHVKLINIDRNAKTIVPMHKSLAQGTLHIIFQQSKLTKSEKKELV